MIGKLRFWIIACGICWNWSGNEEGHFSWILVGPLALPRRGTYFHPIILIFLCNCWAIHCHGPPVSDILSEHAKMKGKASNLIFVSVFLCTSICMCFTWYPDRLPSFLEYTFLNIIHWLTVPGVELLNSLTTLTWSSPRPLRFRFRCLLHVLGKTSR